MYKVCTSLLICYEELYGLSQVAHPDRYIECYIAEQNLVGVGIGCATRDRNVVFCSTFAAFFSRAFDQIRMGAISQTNANFAGSHAGISIGKNKKHLVPKLEHIYIIEKTSCTQIMKGVNFLFKKIINIPLSLLFD